MEKIRAFDFSISEIEMLRDIVYNIPLNMTIRGFKKMRHKNAIQKLIEKGFVFINRSGDLKVMDNVFPEILQIIGKNLSCALDVALSKKFITHKYDMNDIVFMFKGDEFFREDMKNVWSLEFLKIEVFNEFCERTGSPDEKLKWVK